MGLVATKNTVFGVSYRVIYRLACSATETSENGEVLYEANLDIMLCIERIKGAYQTARMRRRVCASIVHMQQNQVFSQGVPFDCWPRGYKT